MSDLQFEVTIRLLTPVDPTRQPAVKQLMDAAQVAAIGVLEESPKPLKTSLAAALAVAIAAHAALLADEEAWTPTRPYASRARFDDAFNTLKTRFEEEYPNGNG